MPSSSPFLSDNAAIRLSREHVDHGALEELEMHAAAIATPIAINKHDEAALVSRLDKRLLCFAMLGNLVKTMDSTNISAYPIQK